MLFVALVVGGDVIIVGASVLGQLCVSCLWLLLMRLQVFVLFVSLVFASIGDDGSDGVYVFVLLLSCYLLSVLFMFLVV